MVAKYSTVLEMHVDWICTTTVICICKQRQLLGNETLHDREEQVTCYSRNDGAIHQVLEKR